MSHKLSEVLQICFRKPTFVILKLWTPLLRCYTLKLCVSWDYKPGGNAANSYCLYEHSDTLLCSYISWMLKKSHNKCSETKTFKGMQRNVLLTLFNQTLLSILCSWCGCTQISVSSLTVELSAHPERRDNLKPWYPFLITHCLYVWA